MNKAFWKSDWFVGAALSFVFFIAWWGRAPVLESIERDAYDLGVKVSSRDPGDKVVVVAIDDKSIQNIGRWPWSRKVHAAMIDKLTAAGTKTIGSTIFYSEPEVPPGLDWIREFRSETEKLAQAGASVDALNAKFSAAELALDTDTVLGNSFKQAGNVVLGMQFTPGEPVGKPDKALPDYVLHNAIKEDKVVDPTGDFPMPIQTILANSPIPVIGGAARGIGHLLTPPDVDGGIRFEPLVVEYYGAFYPSQSLMVAAAYHNLKAEDIKVNLGDSVQLGNLEIKTDLNLNMNTFFYGKRQGDRPPFDVYSFYDVQQGAVPMENFKDKIVLIGATAFGVGSTLYTPLGDVSGPVLIMAHTVASILNENFFVSPSWASLTELLILALVAGYLIALLPKLNAGPAALISLGLFVVVFATEIGLMASQAIWLKLMGAATLLVIGHVLLTTKRFLVTEATKRRLDYDSAQSNKQLALKFQKEGELDMALEYFRRCPVDESLLEAVYILAGDFERKRQFNKAGAAYEYIAAKDPNFRDIRNKVNRAKQLNDTVIIGGSAAAASAASTMLLDGSISKPMLGRYEVEKELGKGAMGVVYLGKDPKINRVVAIKTMALSQEFDANELTEVKERFFREAETAGRLDQPNIVRIYDVGEEHDLAYIAMEFLAGHDLARYTKPDTLLPLPTVMGIIFKAAMALDYAHKHNVVHRDIKPANIMYEPDSKQVKLTDFGIARITDSSKTKTGMVLGTPSYMSPEQLSGKKVDGRSDLFSLGVMFYQMITGKLPFQGDSMATLMYKIANEAHIEVTSLRPELAKQRPCVSAIIDRALEKDPTKRYQTGADMARDIQRCAKQTQSA
ncbi:MAG: CHASE2 domain-containing protein [Proteobacteria bacterium]|nr:CHASE2 domain-containing protein [Pseudomonadota bacterium]